MDALFFFLHLPQASITFIGLSMHDVLLLVHSQADVNTETHNCVSTQYSYSLVPYDLFYHLRVL